MFLQTVGVARAVCFGPRLFRQGRVQVVRCRRAASSLAVSGNERAVSGRVASAEAVATSTTAISEAASAATTSSAAPATPTITSSATHTAADGWDRLMDEFFRELEADQLKLAGSASNKMIAPAAEGGATMTEATDALPSPSSPPSPSSAAQTLSDLLSTLATDDPRMVLRNHGGNALSGCTIVDGRVTGGDAEYRASRKLIHAANAHELSRAVDEVLALHGLSLHGLAYVASGDASTSATSVTSACATSASADGRASANDRASADGRAMKIQGATATGHISSPRLIAAALAKCRQLGCTGVAYAAFHRLRCDRTLEERVRCFDASVYNELMLLDWTAVADFSRICAIVEDMCEMAIAPDAFTMALLRMVRRQQMQRERGTSLAPSAPAASATLATSSSGTLPLHDQSNGNDHDDDSHEEQLLWRRLSQQVAQLAPKIARRIDSIAVGSVQ